MFSLQSSRILSILCVLGLVLTACAGSGAAPPAPPKPTQAPPSATTAPPVPTAAAKEAAKPAAEAKPAAQIPRGGEIRVGVFGDVEGFDPASRSFAAHWGIWNIYDPILSLDKDGKLQPGLATSWTVDNPMQITLKLRQGVKFSDGTDFNSEAVKFNFERLLEVDRRAAFATYYADIDRVETPDASTAVLRLKQPSAPLLFYLAQRGAMMGSPAAMRKHGEDYFQNPVGTGPYELVEWVKNDRITLKRNEGHWNKESVYPDRVVFRVIPDISVRLTALKTGQVDMIDGIHPKDITAMKSEAGFTYNGVPDPGYYQISMNCVSAPFDKKENRLALFYATDKQAMIQATEFGHATALRASLTPGAWYYDPSVENPKPDLDKAKQYLGQAGNPNGFSFRLQTLPDPLNQSRAQVLQAQWKRVGIEAEIVPVDFGRLVTDLAAGNFQSVWLNSAYRGDPDAGTYGIWHSKAVGNRSKCSAPEVDQAVESARRTYDLNERQKFYGQAEKGMLDNALYIYPFTVPLESVHTNKLVGYTFTPDFNWRFRMVGFGIQR